MDNISAKLVAQLAEQDDELCIGIYKKSGEMLGRILSVLMDIVDPEVIIIDSIFNRSHHLLTPSMQEVIEREALYPCPVIPSGLGELVGDFAALSVAIGGF